MSEHILSRRAAMPSFLIETRRRKRRRLWANVGFATVALMLLAMAVLSILYVGPSPIAGPSAPPLHSPIVR
jgi:hypothetical protein